MTFTQVLTHDFSQFICTIGGQLIGGFGDDGGVEFEWADDIGEDTIGDDGEVTFERSNDRRCYANITVRQNSKGYRRLVALSDLQQAQPNIAPLPFETFNANTGERMSSTYAVFKSRPQPSEQKSAQNRTIQVLLPYAKHNIPSA